ncbi:MAG: 5-methyltetrahydropteroyltriglutamate--homocysteine S-methyltransferase, partial [Bifidobacteriaceae bacterium]|nr:5-methyltetrahydropteroyltriglutamate--homocysteine S-methyltransferase [Bifidobacteriaceae bacterium]
MTAAHAAATCLGYPRQGPDRELKKATEAYWAGRIGAAELLDAAKEIRLGRLQEMRAAGLDEIPSNDFSLYDHVLDTAWMLGALPPRFAAPAGDEDPAAALDRYFAAARGAGGAEPLEMTKWFDTNYHYLVPELAPDTPFALDASKVLAEFDEAKAQGVVTRPVLLGPVSFLLLSKAAPGAGPFEPIQLADAVLPLYADLLAQLADRGAAWAQLDEPCLVLDQPAAVGELVARVYEALAAAPRRPKILLATYFGTPGDLLPVLAQSPVEGLALDFTGAAAANLDHLERIGGLPGKRLAAGLIDGRNIWAADLGEALGRAERLARLSGELDVTASCSLLHVPLDLGAETVPAELDGWLAFARQKLDELVVLARGLREGREAVAEALERNGEARARRAGSPLTWVQAVRDRTARVEEADARRTATAERRAAAQREALGLPELPTTTIGSFPQTAEVRKARAAWRRGALAEADYEAAMRAEIAAVVRAQEELG